MSRRRAAGARSRTDLPPSRMSPSVMSIMRLTIRMAVVLPHPDGPTRAAMSPSGAPRETASTAGSVAPAYRLVAARNSRGSAGVADDPSDWAVSDAVTEDPWAGEGASLSASTQTGRSASLRVRRVLQRVVERFGPRAGAPGDEPVGEPGVLRQQRAVQVRADDAVAHDALEARLPGVAVAAQDLAQRALPGTEVRAAAVVLEARQHTGSAVELHLDGDVADEAVRVHADGPEIDEPEPGDLLVAELVGVAEELEPAADAEDQPAAVGRGVQRVALGRDEVVRAQRLVTILTAAEVEEVVGGRVDRVAEPGGRDLEADPAPLAAALQHEQVAAVGVDVHEVGVQRAHAQRVLRHAAPRPPSRRGRRWPAPGAPARRGGRPRARRPRASRP